MSYADVTAPQHCDWLLTNPLEKHLSTDDIVKAHSKDKHGQWWPLGLDIDRSDRAHVMTVQAQFVRGEGPVCCTWFCMTVSWHCSLMFDLPVHVSVGPGSGEVHVIGADPDNYAIIDSAFVAANLLRIHAKELCSWLQKPGIQAVLRDRSCNVRVHMIPIQFLRSGGSCGAAIFLSLLKLYLGCQVKPNTAVTGTVSLTGHILQVGGVIPKIRAAISYGAERVIIPSRCSEEAKQKLTPVELDKVWFARDVVDVMEHALEGKYSPRPSIPHNAVIHDGLFVAALSAYTLPTHPCVAVLPRL